VELERCHNGESTKKVDAISKGNNLKKIMDDGN
jgi:hypothetical protein